MIYRIRNWHKHFENGEALRYKRWTWLPLPNQHDGKYWRRLWRLENADRVFAAFILLLELASKMPERGILADDEGALTTTDMADKTLAPKELFDFAIPKLITLSWIEDKDNPHNIEQICADDEQTCVVSNRTLSNRTIHIPQEDIDRIYQLWPTRTAKRPRVGRSLKDKDKIRQILTDGKYPLEKSVIEYLKENTMPQDLKTFLNHLPDLTEQQPREMLEDRLARENKERRENAAK